jgi:DNA-binding NtrC family response regulator
MQAGAFAFFIKPFDNEKFLAVVRRALNNSPAEQPTNASRIVADTSSAS